MEKKIATEEALLDNGTSQKEEDKNHEIQDEETFSHVEKSQRSESGFKLSYPQGTNTSVSIDELEVHPLSRDLYPLMDEERIKLLAESIKENSLYMKLIVNKNLQILSGNLRFRALQQLNVKSLEVVMVDIKPEEESEYIISLNNHRIKNIFDQRNEIMLLWEKYSPGQGNRDPEVDGEEKKERRNTVKRISQITGYSTTKISNIRKVDSTYPDFIEEIYKENLTLNGAIKKCKVIDALENLGKQVEDLEIENLDEIMKSTMMSYCEVDHKDYYKMIDNGEMNPMDAYDKIIGKKKRITGGDGDSDTQQGKSGEVDSNTYCPCCSSKVEAEKDIKWIKEYRQKIHEYIVQLRF